MRYKKLVTLVESHASTESARERRIALYESDRQYPSDACRHWCVYLWYSVYMRQFTFISLHIMIYAHVLKLCVVFVCCGKCARVQIQNTQLILFKKNIYLLTCAVTNKCLQLL